MVDGHDDVPEFVAHTPNAAGMWHELVDHLTSVGTLAEEFAGRFGAGEWARLAGLWHDLGKADPAFRDYLVAANAGGKARSPGIGHSAAGAALAADAGLEPLAFVIAGHHEGLRSKDKLKDRLKQAAGDAGSQEARALLSALPELAAPTDERSTLPQMLADADRSEGPFCLELLIRMVFSSLIDADRLDTEAHVHPAQAEKRQSPAVSVSELLARLRARHEKAVAERAFDPVSATREEIRGLVVDRAAQHEPGLFTLTSPTGSGKTLTVLEAALAHAERHGLERVVFAVPFISVTEQVAKECRDVLDMDGDAVLEHHSNVPAEKDDDDRSQHQTALRHRLATENWDMPVVVTTTVQLLESLFSNRPNACRKLHRLAGSVIVIDETQSIPWRLVDPAAGMLWQLTKHFGSSVILSTATQPRFGELPSLARRQVAPTELLGEPERWSPQFERARVRPLPGQVDWDDLADEVIAGADEAGQALVVLNTIADAEQVAGLLAGYPGVQLLTTRLCPAHRRDVLAGVRSDLVSSRPVILVSTQLVEAGVDVDFPVGFRAMGPVPSVAQVAGRVNRHGRAPMAELVVFDPVDGHLPPGEYTTGTAICRSFLTRGEDLLAPATVDAYFRELRVVQEAELVALGIDERRRHLDFPQVAEKFRMIADDTVGVLVPYRDFDPATVEPPDSRRQARAVMRRLQPYMVSLRRTIYDQAVTDGLTAEMPGLPVRRWVGDYDRTTGLVTNGDSESKATIW